MQRFGATDFLPAMVSLSVVRELAPVITALIFAGRVSSGIGAELGSMRVTEQIDAMEVSANKSFQLSRCNPRDSNNDDSADFDPIRNYHCDTRRISRHSNNEPMSFQYYPGIGGKLY